jgi:undecaprenyl-diphosphatase
LSSIIQQEQKKIKKPLPGTMIIAMILLAGLVTFLLLLTGVVSKHTIPFDEFIFRKLRLITSPALTKFMSFITFFGSFDFLFSAYIILIISYFLKKAKTTGLLITLIGLSSTGILFLLKWLVKRSRPMDPLLHAVNGFSFPSGHAFSGFTFFGLLIYMVWQCKMKRSLKWLISILLFVFISLIAFSRIYLHVHFASDVLAGFCLAIIWLTLSYWIWKAVKKRRNTSTI